MPSLPYWDQKQEVKIYATVGILLIVNTADTCNEVDLESHWKVLSYT